MKLRSGSLIVLLFIGVNYFTLAPDVELKKNIQEQVIVAAKYYKDKVYYYYLKATGQIPPPIITNHYGDWVQFQIVCDAFLLDAHQSEEIFSRYVRSRNLVIQNNRNRQLNPNRMSREDGLTAFSKRQKDIIDSFKKSVINDFSADELAVIDELLAYPRFFPDSDLRALRSIQLDSNQRKAIRPLAIQLIQSYPKYILGYPTDEIVENMEENEGEIEKVKRFKNQELFKAALNETLTAKQLSQWKGRLEKSREAVQEYCDHQEYRSRYFFTRRQFSLPAHNVERAAGNSEKNTAENDDSTESSRS